MADKNIIKDLKDLINKIDATILPYQKGNCIRIGDVLVQERKNDFTVYNVKTKKQIAILFCKTSAVALAKTLSSGRDVSRRIKALDKIIEKNYIDCMFYKNVMRKKRDQNDRDIIYIRYEIAHRKTQEAKHKLDRFIF